MTHVIGPAAPAPPPDQSGRHRLGRLARDRALGLLGGAVRLGIAGVVIWAFFFWDRDDDGGFVYDRYNDALVAGDVGAAWGLTCPEDRETVSLDDFERRVARALRPLGELESWSRLRGGPEWHGTLADEQRRPEIVDDGDQPCVRIDANPWELHSAAPETRGPRGVPDRRLTVRPRGSPGGFGRHRGEPQSSPSVRSEGPAGCSVRPRSVRWEVSTMAAEFEVYKDNAGEYRWRLQANNNEVVADSNEGYSSKDACLHGIDVVRRIASSAPINDLT